MNARPLKPMSAKPPVGGGGITPSFPEWMADAIGSDLHALIEAREAPARAAQAAHALAIRGSIRAALQYVEDRGDVTWTPEHLEQTAQDIEKALEL